MANVDPEQFAELISAYLDGELNASETELVERALRDDPAARQLMEELRRTVELVSDLPRHAAPPSILEDVCAQVERAELLGDFDTPIATPGGRRTPVVAWLSMAAAVAIVAFGTVWYAREQWSADGDMSGSGVVALVPTVDDIARDRDDETTARRQTGDKRSEQDAEEKTAHVPFVVADKDLEKSKAASPKKRTARRAKEESVGEGPSKGPQPSLGPVYAKSETPAPDLATIAKTDIPVPIRPRASAYFYANATIDQKISTTSVGELRRHTFDNEPVQLRITVPTAARRDWATGRLLATLAKNEAVDLATGESNRPAAGLADAGFFFHGSPGVNFEATDDSRVLVRVPPETLGAVLEEIDRTPERRVALTSGPATVRGLRRIRQTLGMEKGSAPADEALAERSSLKRAYDLEGAGLFDGLFGLVELDPDLLTPLAPTTGEVAEPTTDSEPLVGPPAPGREEPAAEMGSTVEVFETPTVARVDRSSEDETNAKGADAAEQQEHRSLVRRRLEAVENQRQASAARERRWAATPDEPLDRESSQRPVTLVICLEVAKPASPKPAPKDQPKPRPGSESSPAQ